MPPSPALHARSCGWHPVPLALRCGTQRPMPVVASGGSSGLCLIQPQRRFRESRLGTTRSGALPVLAVVILQVVVDRLIAGWATPVRVVDLALTCASHRCCPHSAGRFDVFSDATPPCPGAAVPPGGEWAAFATRIRRRKAAHNTGSADRNVRVPCRLFRSGGPGGKDGARGGDRCLAARMLPNCSQSDSSAADPGVSLGASPGSSASSGAGGLTGGSLGVPRKRRSSSPGISPKWSFHLSIVAPRSSESMRLPSCSNAPRTNPAPAARALPDRPPRSPLPLPPLSAAPSSSASGSRAWWAVAPGCSPGLAVLGGSGEGRHHRQ